MKYLLAYKDFGKLVKEWEIIQQQDKIKLQKGNGLIATSWSFSALDGFYDYIDTLICHYGYAEVATTPIEIKYVGTTGDSFHFTIPKEYHYLPVYNVKYMGKIKNCILTTEKVYNFFSTINLV